MDTQVDPKLLAPVERAYEALIAQKAYGVAVILITKEANGEWGIDLGYQGPLLNLIAGCDRLQYAIHRALDNLQPLPKPPNVSS